MPRSGRRTSSARRSRAPSSMSRWCCSAAPTAKRPRWRTAAAIARRRSRAARSRAIICAAAITASSSTSRGNASRCRARPRSRPAHACAPTRWPSAGTWSGSGWETLRLPSIARSSSYPGSPIPAVGRRRPATCASRPTRNCSSTICSIILMSRTCIATPLPAIRARRRRRPRPSGSMMASASAAG